MKAGSGFVRSHRVSYMVFVGAIPDGAIIMHVCDNPLCVNPSHLIPGTFSDNSRDMVMKGRNKSGRLIHDARCGCGRRPCVRNLGKKA
jgi:hypothetical protein